jgi:hypothetical protein
MQEALPLLILPYNDNGVDVLDSIGSATDLLVLRMAQRRKRRVQTDTLIHSTANMSFRALTVRC